MHKNIDRLAERFEAEGVEVKSPLITFYLELKKAGFNVNLRSFGLACRKPDEEDKTALDLRGIVFSQDYLPPFISAIKHSEQL